jgi:hypothetical protein
MQLWHVNRRQLSLKHNTTYSCLLQGKKDPWLHSLIQHTQDSMWKNSSNCGIRLKQACRCNLIISLRIYHGGPKNQEC